MKFDYISLPITSLLIAFQVVSCSVSSDMDSRLVNEPATEVRKFSVFEINMKSENPGRNPYVDGPEVTAVFTGPDKTTYRVNGYWDGEDVFSIRFSPRVSGRWTFETSSSDRGLDGIRGTFRAVNPTKEELEENILHRGFLKADGYGWKLSDGTPFLPIGETQWSFIEEFHTEEWQDWVRAMKDRGFNTFLGCIWLSLLTRAEISPFVGPPQDDVLNETFFNRLDEWVQFANVHGIMMGLTIGGFPDNSKWFTMFNTKERNDRWFRYCVRRYAAYNVRWALYGEVDEVNPPWSSWEDNAEAMAQLIRDEDPYNHPIGSHHRYIDRATARSKNIDYLCIQSNRNMHGRMNADFQYLTTKDYRQYGKPLWFEEYWYEYSEGLYPGIYNTYRNFVAGMAFPTMGSLMRAHERESIFVPHMAAKNNISLYQYLMERDTGMLYMQHFHDFFVDVDMGDFAPALDKIKDPGMTHLCGRFGDSYIIFKQQGGQISLDLSDASGNFQVEKMDIRSGNRTRLPDVAAGKWVQIDLGDTTDVVVRVKAGKLPRLPVLNSPLEDWVFIPGEKIYVHAGTGDSKVSVELTDGNTSAAIPMDIAESTFLVPVTAREGQQVKITVSNNYGKKEQRHQVVASRKNMPPVLTTTIANIYSGETVGIQLGFSDPDGPGPYFIEIISGPSNGELSGTGNDRRYSPNPGFVGTDRFIWQVHDGIDQANRPATVIIHVKEKVVQYKQ